MRNESGYSRSVQLGNAGEHLVMAHLLAQKFQAFMADRGNTAFDISVVAGKRHSLLRVKTTNANSVVWSRKKSGETFLDPRSRGDYCCIVDLRNGVSDAEFYIVPTGVVQRAIDEARRDWLSKPRRDGKARKDSTAQRLHLDDRTDRHAYEGFAVKWGRYLSNWDQLRDTNATRNVKTK